MPTPTEPTLDDLSGPEELDTEVGNPFNDEDGWQDSSDDGDDPIELDMPTFEDSDDTDMEGEEVDDDFDPFTTPSRFAPDN